MRIAYISFEHPLGIAGGGIGTYVGQIAKLMASRGHSVEVFTGHNSTNETLQHDGYTIHRVMAADTNVFRDVVAIRFAAVHAENEFDIIESPEFGADALRIKQQFPKLPVVVKLHTPTFLLRRLNTYPPGFMEKARFMLGGLVRGRLPRPYWQSAQINDPEKSLYHSADAVSSPSKSLASIVGEVWGRESEIVVIPYVFEPIPELLAIPAPATARPTVSFFGKLEKRKGVLDLAEAIPVVLQRHPEVLFRFVGSAHPSPKRGMDMEAYIRWRVGSRWQSNIEFTGFQHYSTIPQWMLKTDICVFPSLWENFPNVCLEAMAANRAVVASNSGGMAEMIEDGKNGLLVPPADPNAIAEAVKRLVTSPEMARSLGEAARERVLEAYNGENIGRQVEDFFERCLYKPKAGIQPAIF